MNGQEDKKRFLQANSEQLESIAGVGRQLMQHKEGSTDLEVRQYQHLRKEYLQQLAELMEQMPASMKLDVIEHV